MRRKITAAIIILAFIGLIVVVFRDRSPFGKENSSFAVKPKEEITRIEFSQDGKDLTLEKKGHNWLLNGKAETRKSGINFIIRILHDLEIKSPVSDELFEKEISEKNIIPVKVKVYENNSLLKNFLVYKTQSNIYGNIMKIKAGSKPFIVNVPGYEGNIGTAFTLNELFWQPYTIFNTLPSEIASVQVENLQDTSASFSIFRSNHGYVLYDMKKNLIGWDTALVTRYLSYFVKIPFEEWALDMGEEEKETLSSQEPMYRITLNTTDGIETVLTLWERLTDENGTLRRDNDRLYGKTAGRDEFFILRYFDVDPVLKKRSYFFPQ